MGSIIVRFVMNFRNQLILATGGGQVVYPVVVVEVDGFRCRALLDTGTGSSYVSTTLISKLNRKPDRKEYKRIEIMIMEKSEDRNVRGLSL